MHHRSLCFLSFQNVKKKNNKSSTDFVSVVELLKIKMDYHQTIVVFDEKCSLLREKKK